MRFMVLAAAAAVVLAAPPQARADHGPLQAALAKAAQTAKAGAILDVQGCGLSFSGAAGLAERKKKKPMPVGAPLRIGSVSKLYLAAAAHRLAGAGVVDLDKPATTYLMPDDAAGVAGREATLRQLLNHTAGAVDYYDAVTLKTWDWTKPIPPERVFAHVKGKPATHAPGAAFAYSNTGYHLLAVALERASGKPLGALLQETVFAPLGFTQTTYNLGPLGGPIHGYGTELDPRKDTWAFAENTGPDGGITAPAPEVRALIGALFLKGGAMAQLGAAMAADPVVTERPRVWAGAGAEVRENKEGLRIVGHTGNVAGYLTFAFAAPSLNATMVGHVNADNPEAIAQLLRDAAGALTRACAAK